jgi:outer membrane protein OmpA-like peptidoglycan-associated protein
LNHRIASALLVAVTLCAAARADAQYEGFTLDRFQLAPTPEDGLALQLPSTLGPGRWSARLALVYQREALVLDAPASEELPIVADHFALQAALAIGLGERLELFAVVPVVMHQSTDQEPGSGVVFPVPRKSGLGDPAVGASAHLLGDRERGLSLGINAAVLVPVGSGTALASDGKVGARGTLAVAVVLPGVTFAIEGGAAYRPERQLGVLDSGSELLMRAGAYVPIAERLRLLGEVNGATRLGDGKTFEEIATPLEALLGLSYTAPIGLSFGIAGGPGLTDATGTPALRAMATTGFAPPREPPAPPTEFTSEPAPAPEPVPLPPLDGDGDGVIDNDRCPSEAEDEDGVEDEDGCPEPDEDGDGDGIRDLDDRCPAEAETVNGHEDQDGCPDQPPAPAPAAELQLELEAPSRFAVRSASIRPEMKPQLERALSALTENPELRLSIEGHASADGSEEINQKLSEQRAQAVQRWFVQRGIARERLETRGLGSSQPVAESDDEDVRARSRRVELRALP